MSRWGRGRGGSVAVPLEHLFRENSNCPSAARSAGTVGKWGITSFTSTRSTPYTFGGADVAAFQKKPKQDQNSPLTVPALEANVPPPKPKKFFKSRNADASENAALPTSSVAPPSADKAFPSFSKKEDKPAKPISYSKKPPKQEPKKVEKMEIPKLKIHLQSPKNSKGKFFASKGKKEDLPTEEKTHLSPNKRYLSRNRDKVINYSEDRSNSPPAASGVNSAFASVPVKVSTPKTSPATAVMSPVYVKPGLMSPTNKDGKPPIVLRISKGTSRLLSTDSEEIITSPNADRHSFSDPSGDISIEDRVTDKEPETSGPGKQEGIKITIKCYSGNKEKPLKSKADRVNQKAIDSAGSDNDKDSGQATRATRASRRNQHKDTDTEEARGTTPPPGSDNYELYRTLASPANRTSPPTTAVPESADPSTAGLFEDQSDDDRDVEMRLADVTTANPAISAAEAKPGGQFPRQPVLQHVSKDDEKSSENATGRPTRHRVTVNYNENASNYIDDITAKFNKNPAKSYSRKGKKKADTPLRNSSEGQPADAMVPEILDMPIEKDTGPEGEPAHVTLDPPAPPLSPPAADTEPAKTKNNKKLVKSVLDFDDSFESDNFSDVSEKKLCDRPSKTLDKHTFKSPKRLLSETSPSSADLEDKPSVKLVITKKKGSIFKSRSLVTDESGVPGKKRHLYKHKWADDGKGGQTPRPEPEPSATAALQELEDDSRLTRVTRYQKDRNPSLEDQPETYTSLKCPKSAKDYYTVVRNVKKAHQMQEIGEFQEFNDDVDYLLDTLRDNNPMATRCLSAITLASKCMAPAFRMHVRAHGTVAKFFRALHDAKNNQSLGLCTATVMFVLSQDRLNMDLDRESLELMLNLLESDVSHKDALDDCGLTSLQLDKNKERVRELCAEIKSEGKANHLDLDNITVGHLAMETLLSLTSKRAGEWFKEELRVLGGVDHILSTICDCCARIGDYVVEWSPALLDLLRKVDRCMRVLENVTQQNEENQTYLVRWKEGLAIDTLVKLFCLCDREIPLYPTGGSAGGGAGGAGATVRDALLPTLKVLVNLTHPFSPKSMGSTIVGERPGIVDASLHLLLQAPNYIPEHNNFEFSVCVLLLLINLMQNNSGNINILVKAQAPADFEAVFTCNKPAIQALIDHFYKREELARLAEQNTDAILDGEKVKEDEPKEKEKKNKSNDEFIEETVAKLLQKAGSHMEHTMVASYIVLLLGHVVMDSEDQEANVRRLLPRETFTDMLIVLRKYFSFLNLTASAEAASVAHIKATEKIINYLENCDKKFNAKDDSPPGPSSSRPVNYSNGNSPLSGASSRPDKDSYADFSKMDTNASTASANDFTSESDRMSSSVDMDTSFN